MRCGSYRRRREKISSQDDATVGATGEPTEEAADGAIVEPVEGDTGCERTGRRDERSPRMSLSIASLRSLGLSGLKNPTALAPAVVSCPNARSETSIGLPVGMNSLIGSPQVSILEGKTRQSAVP